MTDHEKIILDIKLMNRCYSGKPIIIHGKCNFSEGKISEVMLELRMQMLVQRGIRSGTIYNNENCEKKIL